MIERLDIGSNDVNIMQVKSHYLANYFTFCIKIGPTSGQKFPKIIMAGGERLLDTEKYEMSVKYVTNAVKYRIVSIMLHHKTICESKFIF